MPEEIIAIEMEQDGNVSVQTVDSTLEKICGTIQERIPDKVKQEVWKWYIENEDKTILTVKLKIIFRFTILIKVKHIRKILVCLFGEPKPVS